MAEEVIQITIREDGSAEVAPRIKAVGAAADEAADNLDKVEKQAKKTTDAMGFLKTALAAVGIGFGIHQLVEYTETYSGLITKLRQVSSSNAELISSEQALFDISQRTTTGFKDNVEIFASLSKATKQYGFTQKDVLETTDVFANALDASGKSATEARGAINALTKGLVQGQVQGRSFAVIFQQLPVVAQAVAREMNVSISKLDELAKSGELTGKKMLEAVRAQKEFIATQQSLKIDTIKDALGNLQNAMLRWVGQMDQAKGVSHILAEVILFLAKNFETLVKVLAIVVIAWGTYTLAVTLAATATGSQMVVALGLAIQQLGVFNGLLVVTGALIRGGLIAAFSTLGAFIAANPFAVLVTALVTVIALFYAFGNSIKVTTDGSITAMGALKGAFNFLAAGVSVVIDYLSRGVQWVRQNETAMNVLKVAVGGLAAAFVVLAAGSILSFLSSLLGIVLKLAIAFGAALFNPVTAVIALFVAGAVAVAYMTGNLDKLIAKTQQMGNALVTKMREASTATNEATKSTLDMGKSQEELAKIIKDQTNVALDEETKKLAKTKKGHEDNKRAAQYYIDTVVNGEGKVKFVVRQTIETYDDYLQRIADLRREAAETAAEMMNKYMEASQKIGDSLELASRRGTQAFYDLQNAATGTASSIASSMESASNSASGRSSSGAGGSGPPQPSMFETTYRPKWGPQDKSAVAGAGSGAGGLVEAVSTWLAKWGGQAYGQGQEFANVGRIARTLDQTTRDFIKDLGYVWIPGLRTGGQFTVGGNGGPDTELVQFMATPGERVTVQTPEQRQRADAQAASPGRQPRPVIVNMYVTTPDAESFKRSKRQMEMELLSQLGAVAGRVA